LRFIAAAMVILPGALDKISAFIFLFNIKFLCWQELISAKQQASSYHIIIKQRLMLFAKL
jgi:hypothetical protein